MNRELWSRAVAFHGHECPGLAIGVAACNAAAKEMQIGFSDDEEIVCITETDACGVDAIQAIFSCTIGKGNLLYRDTGKQAFSFFNRKNGEKLRLFLKAKKSPEMDRGQWQEYLLSSPVGEIFSFSKPNFEPPQKARMFNTIPCEICAEGAPEHKMRLQDDKTVCLDCFENYDRGW